MKNVLLNMKNVLVVHWKFPSAHIATVNGVITEWPDDLPRPTEENLALWESEYDNRDLEEEVFSCRINHDNLLKAMISTISDYLNVDEEDFKTSVKNKMKNKKAKEQGSI